MIVNILYKKTYEHFVLKPTGIEFDKTIGQPFLPGRHFTTPMIESVRIVRLIIETKSPHNRPDIYQASRKMHDLQAYADFDTRDYFSLGRNNQGNYLLEIPSRPANVRAAERFLEWLDTEMKGK